MSSSPLKTLINIKAAASLPTATLKSKDKKEKRKSKGNSKEVNNGNKEIPNSQWYTGPEVSVVQPAGSVQPVFELRQEVKLKKNIILKEEMPINEFFPFKADA